MKTYHKAVYMPQDKLAKITGKKYILKYSSHAIGALIDDRHGHIKPIKEVLVNHGNIIELTLNEFGYVCKLLIRQKHDDNTDICLVIMPDFQEALVKTVWLCKADDKHETLKREVYATN